MSLFDFNEAEIIAFSLVLVRMSSFVVSWPVFGVSTVPSTIKILFAFVLSILTFPVIKWNGLPHDIGSYLMVWLFIREVFIGLSIGFLARFFFFAFGISGQIISISMGLSNTQLFNPAIGERATPIDQFQVMIASLFFLSVNGHHLFLSALMDSFDIVPLSQDLISVNSFFFFF